MRDTSARPAHEPTALKGLVWAGAGSLVANFFIGTGDISIATVMGAKFGFSLWWTYFVLGIAAWAMMDMSVRWFLRYGRSPMAAFKSTHPILSAYMLVTVVTCSILGSYSQWNACAMALSVFAPGWPMEAAGAAAAGAALLLVVLGGYVRLEKVFLFLLIVLIAGLFASAILMRPDWTQAILGLRPRAPGKDWEALFSANAGSMINAWLVLIYPYTMMEKNWYSTDVDEKWAIWRRARLDFGWGVLAAAVVALPLMACATVVARPFGYVPKNPMDFALLLEPVAGPLSAHLFMGGLFVAAWTAGVGWWVAGTYALLDLYNRPIRLASGDARVLLPMLAIPSIALLWIRLNPVAQILLFSAFLAVVFPVMALTLFSRIARKDMGLFRWNLSHPRGWGLLAADLFAVALSVYVGATTLLRHLEGK